MKKLSDLKVALVHDYLAEYGGAERVVEALHELFPDAPLYTSFVDSAAMGVHWPKFANWKIHQTWLQYVPFHKQLFSPLRFLAPHVFQSLDLSAYDLVISSSNAYFAKAVRVQKPAVHICYCHTPSRSLWGYSTRSDWKSHPLMRIYGTIINHYLRVIDVKVAQDVDFFIANSAEVQSRIKKFYRRDSTIIYPPVNVPEHLPPRQPQDYYLYVSRLTFAKHPEMAVAACAELGRALKVAGTGKVLPELQSQAAGHPDIEFLGSIDDAELRKLYLGARALLYPVEDEDFGIVPVEAMGYGVPVIAYRSGGPKETIIDGKTGLFFDDLSVKGLMAAITEFEGKKFDAQVIHDHATQFAKDSFQKKMRDFVENHA